MLGQIVVGHRRRLGLTQEQLADRSGLSVRAIREIESDRIAVPRATSLRLLADVFGLTGAERTQFHLHAAGTPVTPAVDGAPGRVTPAQLPPDLPCFAGRTEQLSRLDDLLPPAAAGRAAAATVVAISGLTGVGKTTLAVHWAHRVTDRFGSGQLYLDLRGFQESGPAVTPAVALRVLLDALQMSPAAVPAGFDAQVGLYRSLLAGRRMLVLLDNARDADQVRPLLPGAPGCLALVTSRDHLAGLVAADGAHPVRLEPLTGDESRDLLTRRIGAARVATDPHAVDDIVAVCAGLPLALAVVGARAAAHPGFRLAALAAELRGAGAALDGLGTGEAGTDVRTALSWSYRRLGPDAATLFRLLGLVRGPSVTLAAAASLAGRPVPEIRLALRELAAASLVVERTPGRFDMHDLVAEYAAELGAGADREAALDRLFDHYVQSAGPAALLLEPRRSPTRIAPAAPGVTPAVAVDRDEALAWFAAELPALLDAVPRAADAQACRLARVLPSYLQRVGRWADGVAVQRAALDAAIRLGDAAEEMNAHRLLGVALRYLHCYDDAYAHLRAAQNRCRALADRPTMGHIHHDLAALLQRQGRLGEAAEHARRSLELFLAAGDPVGEGRALNGLGWILFQLDDYEAALSYCLRGVAVNQQVGNAHGVAATWDSVGDIHRRLGDHAEAMACYGRAADMFGALEERFHQATVLIRLGDAHRDAADPVAARTAWQRAQAILDDLGHPHAEQARARLHGATPAGAA